MGSSTLVVPVIGNCLAFFLGSAPGDILGDALHCDAVPDAITVEDLCSAVVVTCAPSSVLIHCMEKEQQVNNGIKNGILDKLNTVF